MLRLETNGGERPQEYRRLHPYEYRSAFVAVGGVEGPLGPSRTGSPQPLADPVYETGLFDR